VIHTNKYELQRQATNIHISIYFTPTSGYFILNSNNPEKTFKDASL